MRRLTIVTFLKLLFASFVVGVSLSLLGLTPQELLNWLRRLMAALTADVWSWAAWTASQLLLGAVVVVPIWLLVRVWQSLRRRR